MFQDYIDGLDYDAPQEITIDTARRVKFRLVIVDYILMAISLHHNKDIHRNALVY